VMLELLVAGAWTGLAAYGAWFFSSAKERERAHKHLEELVEESTRKLRKSETQYREVASNIPGIVHQFVLNNGSYSCPFISDGVHAILGWSPEEVKADPCLIFDMIVPEDNTSVNQSIDESAQSMKTWTEEFRIKAKNGKIKWLSGTSSPHLLPDGNILWNGVLIDITERKKAERAIQDAHKYAESIVTTVREPLVILDKDLRVVTASHSFYQTFKVKPEETVGRLLYALGNRQWNIPKLRQLLEEILPKNTAFDDFEVENNFQSIGHRTMLLNARRIYREANKTQMILLAIEDITERKRLQEKLLRSEKFAAIGQLAAVVGHELRNPLGVINNSSYFLSRKLKDVADEKVTKHLKIIERKINSANLIISDLLDFARKKPPTLKQTDLNIILTSVLSDSSIPENIKVTTKLGEIAPMLLDQEQIRRVFQNMILNASQAMSESGKLIIQTSKHDNSVEISFKDTGVGIPEENLTKIFTPLFSTKANGVGLGLAICRQIVEGHGGNITVKSKIGKGSTFTVKLPVERRVKSEK